MNFLLTPYREKRLCHLWDAKSAHERLELTLKYYELFWAMALVTEAELKVVEATSYSNREYVLKREKQPFFTSININQSLEEQVHSQKLKAALNAVFFESQKKPASELRSSIQSVRSVNV